MSNPSEVFAEGATTSQHVDAENDNHFENTTFKLKRTRSMGLLDEFILPTTPAEGGDSLSQPTSRSRIAAEGDAPDQQLSEGPAADSAPAASKPLTLDTQTEDTRDSAATSDGAASAQESILEQSVSTRAPDMIPHDDTDLQEEPLRHVDYLLHQWDVSDISKSWRYVIQKRRDVADSARLENASWRTWAQRRLNLKTILPEAVNWSKESDVTWLYGPILKDEDAHQLDEGEMDHKRSTTATSVVAGDISLPLKSLMREIERKTAGRSNASGSAPKPILKHRTVEDMMILHSNLLKLQLATQRLTQRKEAERVKQRQRAEARGHLRQSLDNEPPEFDDYDAISAKLNSQYSRNSLQVSLRGLAARARAGLTDNESKAADAEGTHGDSGTHDAPVPKDRHIHFNNEVQQCMAVDEYNTDEGDYYDDTDDYDDEAREHYVYRATPYPNEAEPQLDDDDNDDDDDDLDEGGFFLKVRLPLSASVPGGLPGFVSQSGSASALLAPASTENLADSALILTTNSSKHRSIMMLPATTLNHGLLDEESDDDNPYTLSLLHYVNNDSSRGYDYHYDYNTVYTVDPGHAIYGTQSQLAAAPPDVVDVPENIELGSNFDYDKIESDDAAMPIINSEVIHNNRLQLPVEPSEQYEADSESDSDLDDGLSIETKNSSHSLAQLVFGLTSPPPPTARPAEANPDERASGARKPLSNLLADLFFGTGGAARPKGANPLAELFFNSSAGSIGSQSPPVYGELQNQRKLSPLPPHITSANAFSGNTTPPKPGSGNTFVFDSDSESEDEFVEDIDAAAPRRGDDDSYAALTQVAGENGIRSPSPDGEPAPTSNFVDHAKGLANRLGWANR